MITEADTIPDMMADIERLPDRGESIGLIEPLFLGETSRARGRLADMALELAQKAAGFRRSLPPGIVSSLAALVRSMNCYYSNLIEGHNTHPIDIERALRNDYSADRHKRNLQIEARAHIAVQNWIDEGGSRPAWTSAEAICELHRRFYEELPDELRLAEDPDTGVRSEIIPGRLRHLDIRVGRHIGVSPGAVPRFLGRFAEGFGRLGKAERIIAAAAAHHRLVWIHPFLDGNGRVVRLMSHATMLDTLETGAIWSISRGLARNVAAYKGHLAACDLPRRNDLDGRGSLSEEALAEFSAFFLQICLDQVDFMESLVQPDRLRTRILMWAEEEVRLGALPARAGQILEALLYRGELRRGDIAGLSDVGERQGRRIVAALEQKGVLASDGLRAPITLRFPATLASRWMPGLFPDQVG
jgi:Fic family protein